MLYNNVLEAVGSTPLIRLNRIKEDGCADIYVKFEAVNIGGSIKTRTALAMIEDAEKKGLLNPDSIIVEATSGNQGIGLALVGAVKGYKTVVIMPDSVSRERLLMMHQYGAEVRLIHDKGNIGVCMDECLKTVDEMAAADSRVFVPRQFSNEANTNCHAETTADEILKDIGRPIDGFCSGIGTGGTLTGIGRALKAANPDIRIWAAEPSNSAVLSGGKSGSHIQMGIGDGLIPDILDTSLYSGITVVTDDEAVLMARRLAREEGLACGISGGTNVVAALRLARELGEGKTVVTVLADMAERYFTTPLFNEE